MLIYRLSYDNKINSINGSGSIVEVELIPVGKYVHPEAGKFEVTLEDLQKMIVNFAKEPRGKISYNYNHSRFRGDAAGWIKQLFIDPTNKMLKGFAEFSPEALDAIRNGTLSFTSPEFSLNYIDKFGKAIGPSIRAAALTPIPFFDHLKEIAAEAGTVGVWCFEAAEDEKGGIILCDPLSSQERNALSDEEFGYIDPSGGKHFPLNDENHVRLAVQLMKTSPYGPKAKSKILSAARKYGIKVSADVEQNMPKKKIDETDETLKGTPESKCEDSDDVSSDTSTKDKKEDSKKDDDNDPEDQGNDNDEDDQPADMPHKKMENPMSKDIAAKLAAANEELESLKTKIRVPAGTDPMVWADYIGGAFLDTAGSHGSVVAAEMFDSVNARLTATEKVLAAEREGFAAYKKQTAEDQLNAEAEILCESAIREGKLSIEQKNSFAFVMARNDKAMFKNFIDSQPKRVFFKPVTEGQSRFDTNAYRSTNISADSSNSINYMVAVNNAIQAAAHSGVVLTMEAAMKKIAADRPDLAKAYDNNVPTIRG